VLDVSVACVIAFLISTSLFTSHILVDWLLHLFATLFSVIIAEFNISISPSFATIPQTSLSDNDLVKLVILLKLLIVVEATEPTNVVISVFPIKAYNSASSPPEDVFE
jgi:hypothetical protein